MECLTTILLCTVVDKMCKNKVENITKDDLRHLYFYLTGIQKITGFALVSRYLESFKDVMKAFLGFEAIRFYKGVREKLEAEMERCKENLEKLETYASETSHFMGECLYKASEWEQMTRGDKWF
ncbi:hypothetical protein L484_020714 [Morus notabilis]|uniref:Uncharacterized protein n=1 Tax=Morus notabilis TaxID=981085 RepID=W9QLV0_9ROSA|nr:hypothetical protein L484_020714 [Morus notabilis]